MRQLLIIIFLMSGICCKAQLLIAPQQELKCIEYYDSLQTYKVKFSVEQKFSDSLVYVAFDQNNQLRNCEKNCKTELAKNKFWNGVKNYAISILGTAAVVGWSFAILKP